MSDFDIKIEKTSGLYLKEELATIDDPESPVDIIYAGFPAPLFYIFHTRSGNNYIIDFQRLIQQAIREIAAAEESHE
jgi:hypothetical protein